jgi:hypothetical protein
MSLALDRVVACQDEMIEALDRRDAEAIELATIALAEALHGLAGQGAVYAGDEAQIDLALRKADAARIRVNILSDWTRQRIDQLSEIRSGSPLSYGKQVLSPQAC